MKTATPLLLSLCTVALLSTTAIAGDGRYDSDFGIFDFGISVRFDATQMQIDRMEQEFEKASLLICDASDGQQEFGQVVLCNDSRGGASAEFWVFENGRSNAPGRFGVAGQHINQYYSDIISSSTKADGSWVLAHEFGHHAYGIKDEYSGPTADGGLKCITTPADPTTQTACLIENFWIRGADGVSLTEWCVSSNHDPDNDTYQESVNDESCWETIVAAYPDLTAPVGLPDAGPGGPLLTFDWQVLEEENRFVIVIDKSGSMGSQNKMELAKLGGKIFTNLVTPPDKLGVVAFDSSATDTFAIAATDAGVKTAAKAAIDTLVAGGGTSIGAGLLNGLNMILSQGDRACQQAIVLLSDGQGGNHLSLLDQLLDNGIVVHTIALGTGADVSTMQQIATDTSGKFFSAIDGIQLPGIFAQLAADVAEGGVLNTQSGTLAPGDDASPTFPVDSTSAVASFVASWDTLPDDVSVTLKGPGGTFSTGDEGGSPDFVFAKDESSVSMTLGGDSLVAGNWSVQLEVSNDAASAVSWDVQALSDSKVISFYAESDQDEYAYPAEMTISATVNYGPSLAGVSISGVVRRPSGTEAPIVLRDDGSAASGDEFANDGIYTGRFGAWSQSGAYTVALDAVNEGNASVVAGETLSLSEPDATDPGEFTRHSEFSVTATGVPELQEFGLGVDKLKVSLKDNPAKSKLAIKGQVELDELAVNPLVDDLFIEVGNLDFTVLGSSIKKVGKKDRYVFNDKDAKTKGFVDLFNKGSSKGVFSLSDKAFAGFFGSLTSVLVSFEWGSMDVSNTLGAIPNKKNTATSFVGKKHLVTTDNLIPTSLVAKLNTKKVGKDSLTLRAKLGGGGFNTSTGDTTFRVGPFEHVVSSEDWSVKKETRFTYKSPDKTVTIKWDSETEQLLIVAKKIDMTGFANPIIVEVMNANFPSFDERLEITASTNKNQTKYVY
ncbi:MAG: hypothetical protein DHS20C15_31080 [Planctomycetota bacterium]|nr:MAG: hypothetical protein DHS20C15_31080 [Planctomycetota bacterium]